MTTTEDLIGRLAGDLRPVQWGTVRLRLAAGIGSGALVAFLLMVFWLGIRPDFWAAIATPGFWIKFFYTLLLVTAGLSAVDHLARPAGRATGAALLVLLTVAVVAGLAIAQVARAPGAEDRQLLFGQSSSLCPWIIVILSLPIVAGTFWAMRGLAPTRLAVAGCAAGLMAGAFGAFIYSFHCDEWAIPFLMVWYSLGIVIVTAIGTMAGQWALRWR